MRGIDLQRGGGAPSLRSLGGRYLAKRKFRSVCSVAPGKTFGGFGEGRAVEEEVLERTAQEGARGHDLCPPEDVAQPFRLFTAMSWQYFCDGYRLQALIALQWSPGLLSGSMEGLSFVSADSRWAAPLMGTTTSSNGPLGLVLGSRVDSFLLGMWSVMTQGLPETTQPAQL